jgi:hypothetical protein
MTVYRTEPNSRHNGHGRCNRCGVLYTETGWNMTRGIYTHHRVVRLSDDEEVVIRLKGATVWDHTATETVLYGPERMFMDDSASS